MNARLSEQLIAGIVDQAPSMAAFRRDIHAHPELAYEEFRTADRVAEQLTQWGIPIHRGLAKTGIVGILKNGSSPREMIKEGLFEKFPMDAVFAMHNWPGLKAGQFAVSPGPAMASATKFTIRVHGKGGHAALPHDAIDPIPIACRMVDAFQGILTRDKKADETAVITVTAMHAGEAFNVIPDSCELKGTIRTFSVATIDMIETRMRSIAGHLCETYGARCELIFDRIYPPTVNSAAEAGFMRGVMASLVGEANVLPQDAAMTSEDFSFMLLEKPGAYAFIGNGDGTHREMPHGAGPCMLHNASYDFNDALIPIGSSCWVRLAEAFLKPAG